MTLPPAVFDTNVVVSGLITGDPESPAARILDGILTAQWVYLLSPALLAEYRTVLLRPKMRQLHGLEEADIEVKWNRIKGLFRICRGKPQML